MNATATSKNVVVNNVNNAQNLGNQGRDSKKNPQKPITIWMKKILGPDLKMAGVKDNQLLGDYRLPGKNGNVLAEGVRNLLEDYLQLCRAIQAFDLVGLAWTWKNLGKPISELWQNENARSLAKTIDALSNKKDFMFVQTEEHVGKIVQTAKSLAKSVREHWKQTAEMVNQNAGRALDEVERALEGKTDYEETPLDLSSQICFATDKAGRYISDALKERASKLSEKIRQYEEVWKGKVRARKEKRDAEEQAWRAAETMKAAEEKARKAAEEVQMFSNAKSQILDHVEAQIASGVSYQKSKELQALVIRARRLASSHPSEEFNERIVAIATSTPGKKLGSLAAKEELVLV